MTYNVQYTYFLPPCIHLSRFLGTHHLETVLIYSYEGILHPSHHLYSPSIRSLSPPPAYASASTPLICSSVHSASLFPNASAFASALSFPGTPTGS